MIGHLVDANSLSSLRASAVWLLACYFVGIVSYLVKATPMLSSGPIRVHWQSVACVARPAPETSRGNVCHTYCSVVRTRRIQHNRNAISLPQRSVLRRYRLFLSLRRAPTVAYCNGGHPALMCLFPESRWRFRRDGCQCQ